MCNGLFIRGMFMDYMKIALEEAKKAYSKDEIPVGAVIVYQNQIIAQAHNLKEKQHCVISHAEMLAIQQASDYFGNWHLNDCEMYVTLEPCMMCSGAIIQSRIKKIIIGARDNRWIGLSDYLNTHIYNYYPEIEFKDFEECQMILKKYFKEKRES